MPLNLFDTARQAIVPFEPDDLVKIYVCGITPYDAAHVGHGAVYTYFDIVQRRLIDLGHRVECVRNVTDVDDDILRKARELNVDYLELGNREFDRFSQVMKQMNLLPMFSEPRASSAIPDILGFIGMVIDRGYAYESGGGVYFDYKMFDAFGQVSHCTEDQMLEFARERGGNVDDPNKRHPLDFILWQPSAPDEPSWPSMWGPGRPGWHIECSALALRELGTTIDLHGGGSDLIFPHHECETAQSEAATGEKFVRHWMHTGMVMYQGEKMSKSLGNLVWLHELLETHSSDVIRAAILDNHYQSEWEWNDSALEKATNRIASWRKAGNGSGALEEVRTAVDNNLDTAQALRELDRVSAEGQGVSQALSLLGFSSGDAN